MDGILEIDAFESTRSNQAQLVNVDFTVRMKLFAMDILQIKLAAKLNHFFQS